MTSSTTTATNSDIPLGFFMEFLQDKDGSIHYFTAFLAGLGAIITLLLLGSVGRSIYDRVMLLKKTSLGDPIDDNRQYISLSPNNHNNNNNNTHPSQSQSSQQQPSKQDSLLGPSGGRDYFVSHMHGITFRRRLAQLLGDDFLPSIQQYNFLGGAEQSLLMDTLFSILGLHHLLSQTFHLLQIFSLEAFVQLTPYQFLVILTLHNDVMPKGYHLQEHLIPVLWHHLRQIVKHLDDTYTSEPEPGFFNPLRLLSQSPPKLLQLLFPNKQHKRLQSNIQRYFHANPLVLKSYIRDYKPTVIFSGPADQPRKKNRPKKQPQQRNPHPDQHRHRTKYRRPYQAILTVMLNPPSPPKDPQRRRHHHDVPVNNAVPVPTVG